MSLGLLFPLGLAALAGLLLPLLLHLARREEQKPTDFAALRWLSARLRPRQRVRFEEWLLLVLRLLLVAVIALLIARPVLWGGAGDAPWLLVAPGADPAAAPSLPDDTQRRWLAPGFPSLDTPRPEITTPIASLLREVDAVLPAGTQLTVLVPPVIEAADGERPRLSREVDWRVVAPVAPLPLATPAPAPRLELAVRHTPAQDSALPYFRAAQTAWGEQAVVDIAAADAPIPDGTQALVWLAPGPLPAAVETFIQSGGRALIAAEATWPLPEAGVTAWQAADGSAIAQAARWGEGQVLQLQASLVPAAMPVLLEPAFPHQLRALLQPAATAPARADAAAQAPLTGGDRFPETPRELVTPLLWWLLALFAIERWLASGRRGIAP